MADNKEDLDENDLDTDLVADFMVAIEGSMIGVVEEHDEPDMYCFVLACIALAAQYNFYYGGNKKTFMDHCRMFATMTPQEKKDNAIAIERRINEYFEDCTCENCQKEHSEEKVEGLN
jgi:hypothetical protein